jgi:predicted membrane channel-forming protein YqfA (hemolysin III family)
LQASQVSGRSDKLPKDNKLHVESISNSDATKLHTEVNEYINQKLTILNISITVFGVVMGWVITGLSSIQNSLQGASNCNVPPVSLQPVTLLLPTVLLFFLCIMLWYIEAISKQMHILSTYLEVFHLSDWESHYQDLLKSPKLNIQSRHKNRRPSWWPQTYSIQSDMPNVILGALIFLTIAITIVICFLYWQPPNKKTWLTLIFFIITSLLSVKIFINLWRNRDLDDFRLEATRSWEDILFCRTLISDEL